MAVTDTSRRRGPLIPGPVETAVLFWRWLRRMRTALYLLAAVGVATMLATVVPQRPNVPTTVRGWLDGSEGPGEVPARMLDAVGAFDVFGTPWFLALLVLLFTSLTACLVPRYRAFWRMLRRGRPPLSRDLAGKEHTAAFVSDRSVEEIRSHVERHLSRSRWRTRTDADDGRGAPATRVDMRLGVVAAPADAAEAHERRDELGAQVAAERGHVLREGGSLVFHTAFYVLLIGVVLGQLTGFTGQVGITEGEPGFTDTQSSYWSKDPGRWWRDADHAAWTLSLDEFDVEFTGGAQPVSFVADVTITHRDGRIEERTTVVNDPLVVDGMKVLMLDWGYAVRVVVRDGDEVVHDGFVTLTGTEEGVWRGAVKAPAADPQLGFEVWLFPDAPEGPDGRPVPTGWPGPRAPLLIFTAYEGDLRLDRVQGVNDLDTTDMTEVTAGGLRPGFESELPGDVTVGFPELRNWVGFQVSRRPTDPLLLLGAGLLLAGLLPALYAYRRRVWVRATAGTEGTTVTIAGHAFQRPQAFTSEFERLVGDLRRELGSGPDHDPPDPDAPPGADRSGRRHGREAVRR